MCTDPLLGSCQLETLIKYCKTLCFLAKLYQGRSKIICLIHAVHCAPEGNFYVLMKKGNIKCCPKLDQHVFVFLATASHITYIICRTCMLLPVGQSPGLRKVLSFKNTENTGFGFRIPYPVH